MNIAEMLDILLFLFVVGALLSGYQVAFALAGSALIFAVIGQAFDVFDLSFLALFPSRIYGTMTNETLIAVPLFVFMGVMLERSKVAEDLLDTMGQLFGSLRGGLGISVVIVGALLAASTGIVGATVVTMGLLSLPTMLKRGYSPEIATGTIAASGTLGQIIPPSIVLILLGDVISSEYQNVQFQVADYIPLSVGDLFAGALIPGLMLVVLYILYLIVIAILRPLSLPAIPPEDRAEDIAGLLSRVLRVLLPPVILIVAVLGSILTGIATATEASAVGAVGATLLAGYRMRRRRSEKLISALLTGAIPIAAAGFAILGLFALTAQFDLRLTRADIPATDQLAIKVAFVLCGLIAWGTLAALWRVWREGILTYTARQTTQITAMVFLILLGAALFSLVFRGLGGDETVENLLTAVPGGATGALIAVMLTMFVLGFFLDFIEITFVVVPIVAPILLVMGVDPVWLGVMMAINLQTSFLTPPFGFALFYLRGVAPPEVTTGAIYRGAIPFVMLQLIGLALVAALPLLATALPNALR